jgi:hypothetical protein
MLPTHRTTARLAVLTILALAARTAEGQVTAPPAPGDSTGAVQQMVARLELEKLQGA